MTARTRTSPGAPRAAVGATIGALASLALHGSILLYIAVYAEAPDLGFEIQLPAEVEFGIAEGMTLSAPEQAAPLPAEAPPPEEPAAPEGEGPGDAGIVDAGVIEDAGERRRRDAGPPDAGVEDAGMLVAEQEEEDAGAVAAEASDSPAGEGLAAAGTGDETRLPAGAQIAMRIDMARIRQSPLAPDVRRFLGQVPDWQALLDGSGIEPLDDLDRLLLASPNLQRSRLVVAGRFVGDEATVRAAVARMASARGETAPWSTRHGVPVAPWHDHDDTERVIAIVGPGYFTITRPEDLPRVLAVAQARREREREERGDEQTGAEALLSMAEGEAVAVEVEGAQQFARGQTRGVPERLRLGVTQISPTRAAVRGEGVFASPELATEAREFWERVRDAYARNPWVALSGMSTPLRSLVLEVEGSRVRFRTELTASQLRLAMSFLEGMMRPRAGAPGSTAPGPPLPPPGPR